MQLDWLVFLSEYRTPFFNSFFKFLNYLDSSYFAFILIPFIWFGYSYRWGIRIFYLTIFNGVLNYLLKLIFHIPRPSIIISDLALVKVGEYSFPSGAAQYSILLASVLMYYWKTSWAKFVGITYVVLIGFSRLYLGVHYPTDLLAGWVVGILVFILFIKTFQKIENKIGKYPIMSLTLSIIIPLLIIWEFQDHKINSFLLSFVAISVGIYISTRYRLYVQPSKIDVSKPVFVIIGIYSIHLIPLIFSFTFPYFTEIQTVIISLWISLFASPLIKLT